jgi:ketosteroid isomerase-like protein
MPETMGSGVAFLDYDVDGWPDLLLVNSTTWPGYERGLRPTSHLYRNLGDGRFEDVTSAAGLDVPLYGMGAVAADYDADGDPDLYLTAVGTNRLLRNDGGRFTDVTSLTGASGNRPGGDAPPAWSTGAAWSDVDRDGWLDLFVCNYVQWTPDTDLFTTLDGTNKSYATPHQYEGESCRMYRNETGERSARGGSFTDVTDEVGLANPDGKSLGVIVEDFNRDGWPDIAVSNDTYQNFLYLNDGDGTFTDAALPAGVAFDEFGRARAGMGIDVADVTSSGRLSIAIGNFSNEPVSLYTQIGDGVFQDLAGSARLTRSTLLPLTFGLLFADLDLDGYPDLLLGNGHIEPDINAVQRDVTFAQPPQLLQNDGRGQFVDVTGQVGGGFEQPIVARGIATADIDRDGDLDLVFGVNGGPVKLLRNDVSTDAARWLRVRLVGEAPNRNAIGAVVTLYAGETAQRRMIRAGSSYLSQSELNPVLFGLGDRTAADSVIVRWPRGGLTRHGRADAGAELVLREPPTAVVTAGENP